MESQTGWTKPQRTRTLTELQQLIAHKRAELQTLEQEACALIEDAKLEAIVKVRNIMRANQLSLDDVFEGWPARRSANRGASPTPGAERHSALASSDVRGLAQKVPAIQ